MVRGRTAYPKVYLADFRENIAYLFQQVGQTNCDVVATLTAMLKSRAFTSVTEMGNPKYLNQSVRQLLQGLELDDHFRWRKTKKKEDLDSAILWWEGLLLEHFRWRYKIDFKDWLNYESIMSVYDAYYPLHEAGLDTASEKLMYRYLYKKAKALGHELDSDKVYALIKYLDRHPKDINNLEAAIGKL